MKYVLDTNVLLHDPNAIFAFGENDIVIPLYVFDEVDKFKKELSQRGKSAREVIRKVEALREKGSLFEGVSLGENLGRLYVRYPKQMQLKIPFESRHNEMDNAILATVLHVMETSPEEPTVFVTMDVNLRIRADALKIRVEEYAGDAPKKIDELYSGDQEITTTQDVIDELFKVGFVPRQKHWDLFPHEFVTFKCEETSGSALGRYIAQNDQIRLIPNTKKRVVSGIRSRNKEQIFAFDILLDPEIPIVTLVGKAGTGKTLLAIAAGLEALEHDSYKALVVSRPVFPMGKELGFLPGDLDSKLNPWMQPIYDNMELIAHQKNGLGATYHDIVSQENIRIEPLTYIRGRSLPNQYIIVDEAQNLTPHEVKTIITRCGDGTKIVLTGDPYQIDNPYVDATNNGLSYVVERFKNQDIAAHITLTHGERSKLAELASNLL